MAKNNYNVYMHTNKTNGKKYIGITCQNPNRRWQNGKGYRTQYFYKAIVKYGWENFEHKVIYTNISRENACAIEKELIETHRTNEKTFGYNITNGGEDSICYYNELHSTKKCIYQYSLEGVFLRYFESLREAVDFLGIDNIHAMTNISSCARKNGKSKSAYGYLWYYDFLGEKITGYDLHREYGKGNSSTVYRYDLNGKYICSYYNTTEASIILNLTPQTIYCSLDDISKSASGSLWSRKYYENGISPYQKRDYKNLFTSRKVVKLSTEGNFICIYDRIKDAGIEVAGNPRINITKALKDITRIAYGYKWMYYDDYLKFSKS